ncbi:MAG: FAD-binding protein [Blastocatellia bacterium]|nr:FAD-binding protein [Blastocatellia bacterium]
MDTIIEKLRAIVGESAVLSEPDELLVYECDGLPQHKYRPRAVVFPSSTEETAAVMRALAQAGVPFTPRGAGTGLSGGALALNRGVVIELARMRQILKIDAVNRIAVVQPGVVNLHVSRAVAHLGLHYVPDPSSQPTCTIGGNIAENAGGIHCLKYGTTTDHVLGLKVVLAGGAVVDLGGCGRELAGYDLLGLFIGSEGTFGIATEATLRLTPIPPAVKTLLAEFAEVNDASHAVSAIIAAGVMPAALEMMDREIIRAVEASVFAAGLPPDAGAALLIELDGIESGLDEEAEQVTAICMEHGARACRSARDENERKKLWAARKGAFGAIGRISPDSMIQDAVVPRSRLPEVLDAAYRIAAKYQLRIANVFHAGDGNLHPLICFDSRFPEEVQRVKDAGRELMETCVRAGGSITGEHGVGLDKRDLLPLIFSEKDMETMLLVRAAFDPSGLMNPGKIIPVLRGCGEARAVASPNEKRDSSASGDLLGPRASRPQYSPSSSPPNPSLSDKRFDPAVAQQQLVQLVGEENVTTSPHLRVSPSALTVTPGSIAEVCEVMKLAFSEGWTTMPAGALRWLRSGNSLAPNLIVSMRGLDRIIEHEPADLVAITEAGVTLKDFNTHLSLNRQWLPIDPPDDGSATIGGVVATGLGGAQQFGYGPPRRHVIGMKVVLADGSLIKAGSRVVKNVAGYDLCKLFTGSYGTLGIIVEVNFKLRPLPFVTRSVLVAGEPEKLLQLAHQIIRTPLFPVAVELVSQRLLSQVTDAPMPGGSFLLVRFAGSESAVVAQVASARELIKNGNESKLIAEDAAIWTGLAALPIRFADLIMWRVELRPTEAASFLTEVIKTSPVETMWHAGVGDGRIRVIDGRNANDGDVDARIDRLRASAKALGGMITIESGNSAPLAPTNKTPATEIMSRIKQQLDPRNVFGSGRFGYELSLLQAGPSSS